MNLKLEIDKAVKEFNVFAKKYLDSNKDGSSLWSAMNYGVVNGGKRIRPFLIIHLSKFLKIKKSSYMRLALATEFVHAYSLIHDDLPGMDNDDLRRGKPTTHKKYGEAVAILAGNSLLTLAFELLSDPKTHANSNIRTKLINSLSKIAGHAGLAGGQSLDLLYEKKNVSEKQIVKMHELKTARLFEFCSTAPLVLSGKSNLSNLRQYKKYGNNFGLIFQATDDLIDYIGEKSITGKNTQKDLKRNKGNIMKYKSINDIKVHCLQLAKKATNSIATFSDVSSPLNTLIFHIINRVQ